MKNRWLILTACVMIQTILGGIYAWSTFTKHLMDSYGLTQGKCGFIFGLTILVFTVAMTFSAKIIKKLGTRVTMLTSAVLFISGYLLASFSGGSFTLLALCIGGITGTGIGLGYACPLSVGMKWFPNKKGLVTGVAVGGFGGGAIILSAIASHFLKEVDVLIFFRYISIISAIILIPSALLLAEPANEETEKVAHVSIREVFSPFFMLLTFCIFSGTFAGLLVIGNLTEIIKTLGFSQAQAISTITFFSLGNVAGRITWGHLFDRLHFKTIPTSLTLFAIFFPLLLINVPYIIVIIAVAFIGFGFGGNFVVHAGAITKRFGTSHFVKLYPICFLGYGVAGLIGPSIGGFIADKSGSYDTALYLSTIIIAIAATLSFFGLRKYRVAE